MFWTSLGALSAGILTGIIAGLIPGLHTNILVPIFIGLFYSAQNELLFLFFLSLGIAQTITDAIPSVFLGAPDPDLVIGVLPSHELYLRGMGYEAIRLLTIGSFFALLLSIILSPLLFFILESLFTLVKPVLVWILILLVFFILFKEYSIWKLIIFALTGILGVIVLNSNIEQPLIPLLSGLFGASGLIISLKQKQTSASQFITQFFKFNKKEYFLSIAGSVCSASVMNLFPGLGPSQATSLMQPLFAKKHPYITLLFVGGVNTADFVISLVMFYILGKTRNGTLALLKTIHPVISIKEYIFACLVLLISGSITVMITLAIARIWIKTYKKIPQKTITITVLLFTILLTLFFSGYQGLIVLIIATLIGIIAPLTNTPRSISMGVLLVPTIMHYL
ncbi:tripartite tricarboxylate transporter permease [Candidatus Woesearchaeota archaeon]|nr:tripartite tricarboxylate transporter permease [Candidatus Woesearchaeota archaeon]